MPAHTDSELEARTRVVLATSAAMLASTSDFVSSGDMLDGFSNDVPTGSSLDRKHRRTTVPCGDDGMTLSVNQACLKVSSSEPVDLFMQSTECYDCPYWKMWTSGDGPSSKYLAANATWTTLFEVNKTGGGGKACSFAYDFGEFGLYELAINGTGCAVNVAKEPARTNLTIFYAFLILVGVKIAWEAGQKVYNSRKCRLIFVRIMRSFSGHALADDLADTSQLSSDVDDVFGAAAQPVEAEEEQDPRPRKKRVKSLDAFRGLSIVIMIFVNYGGGSYWFFAHSPWNGLTVADLVFPWFMWIMGASLAIGARSQLRNGVPRKTIVLRVLKRAATLFFLGVFLNSGSQNDFRTLRIPGVLQRFALTYLAAGCLEAVFTPRELPDPDGFDPASKRRHVLDLAISLPQMAIVSCALALHVLLTFLLPVPGCPTGYLGPGGIQDGGRYFNCTGGAAGHIDLAIFGPNHIYQHPTSKVIYDSTAPYDPEGTLGTLTSLFLVYLGVMAGKTLLIYQSSRQRLARWVTWGLVLGLVAGGLCGFSKEGGVIPINKNLWSVSFILAMASFAFILFSAMYYVIDVRRWWSGGPLHYAGMNSIVLYVGHELCTGRFPFDWVPYTPGHAERLAMNMIGTALWVLVSYRMYKANFFVSV